MSANDMKEGKAKPQTSNTVGSVQGDGSAAIHVGDKIYRFPAPKRRKQAPSSVEARLRRKTVNVPYSPDSKFRGRNKEFRQMNEFLMKPETSGVRDLRIVAIQGLGGMGKTSLALQYIHSNRNYYEAIFWLRAQDFTILQQDFAKIAQALQTTTSAGADMSNEPWILVFDNLDNVKSVEEILADFWPHWGKGHVIVTTRDRDIADQFATCRESKLVLAGLDVEEGSDLLLDYAGPDLSARDLSRNIVNELGGMPLALCQMGTYIRQTDTTLDEFYLMLREQKHSIRLYSDEASTSSLRYSHTLTSYCDLSFAELSEVERHLLAVIAFFQTDEIQESFVTKGCLNVPRLEGSTDKYHWGRTIRTLNKHALLVHRSPEKSKGYLWMHRVIKHHVHHLLDSGDFSKCTDAFEDAVSIAMQMFPSRPLDGGTMSKRWTECELWLPHVLSLKEAFKSLEHRIIRPPRALANLLCNCAYYMWERSTKHVASFAADALEICRLVLPDNDPDPLPADMMTILGALQLVNVLTRKNSISFFQQALQVRTRHMERTRHPTLADKLQLANAYNNTGAGYLAMEQYDEALKYLDRALRIKLELGNEETMPYDIGLSLYNICRVQMGKGQLRQAKANAQKAHSLVKGKNGPDDLRSNQFRFTYADLVVACGDIDGGLRIHKRTLDIRKRVMGPYNNDTGVSYYGMSCVYQRMRRWDEAL
ncbi:NB-ARC domain-containing protein [Penicillium ucsense]|uniref:NB-ARC domain-containing protein n=1 Tax=Penicillium ucsense TaxID=2839758 RepID=A0A8J8WL17_9EURO|nr:NB-ARC domain-containing protein [Penicillium ucsense]KAF7738850.1 NB-ARC domain-containing protein [Penicillium ucsense]